MAGENDTYDGRKPSFDSTGRVRGFRSKPGAPMHDPTQNKGSTAAGFSSNWDSIFRNTASNKFGASGTNPRYFSSFPSAPASPGAGVAGPVGSAPPSFSGTAPSHAQVWSVPPPRRADDSMPGAPYMPKGPNWKMQMPKMADTYDALLEQNKALVAPGGMQGMLQPPGGKTYDPGWHLPSAQETEDIYNRYKPKGAPRSFGWKGSFDRAKSA